MATGGDGGGGTGGSAGGIPSHGFTIMRGAPGGGGGVGGVVGVGGGSGGGTVPVLLLSLVLLHRSSAVGERVLVLFGVLW